ncbi:hypothetical protein [Vibrio variabilis]|uniref:hypothetical protein n=1 Tax=Vibrio variabilis TaxID=990271 RepID=UPI001EFA0C83|nr:hypothetical protein [Vibrio variabilis]
MSYPDENPTASSSGSWYDSILEGAGELVGGAVDVVEGFGEDWLGIKMENELDRAKSASPDENRANNNDYQQPNGQPVYTTSGGMQWQTVAIIVLIALVLLGGFAFALKGASDAVSLYGLGGGDVGLPHCQGNQQGAVDGFCSDCVGHLAQVEVVNDWF